MRPILSVFLLAGLAVGSSQIGEARTPSWVNSPHVLQRRDDTSSTGISFIDLSSDKQSYFTVIKVGDINFRVALDTASADLWIASSGCTSDACGALPKYPLKYSSTTFSAVNGNNTAFNIGYADTTVASGFVAKESIRVANMTSLNQAFAVITNTNVTLGNQISGVLGLGLPRLSTISASAVNATPFFTSLSQSGQLKYPVFGLSLTRDETGTITFGAIDASVVTNISNVIWNKVMEFPPFGKESNASSYLQWALPMDSLSYNDTKVKLTPTYPQVMNGQTIALIDAGTSGLFGPYQDVSQLFSLIPGSRLVDESGQWVVPCTTTSPMTFVFGGNNFTLLPTDYLIGPAAGNPNLCLSWPRALSPSPDGIDWQLGDAFLRTVYSIYSHGIDTKEAPMIGLYPLQANQTNQTASQVSSFLSMQSATIATTLPNFLLPTPTFSTPSYVFNTSVPATRGALVSSGLATSTYSAILDGKNRNISALPTVTPSGDFVTFVVTISGSPITTTSIISATVTLGVPPGYNSGTSFRYPNTFCLGALLLLVLAFSMNMAAF